MEEEDARDVSRGKKKTRVFKNADGAFEEARRLERLRARRAFIERFFLEISTRRDRRARSRRRATFGAAVAFVVAAVLAVHFYSRRADATSVAAEWLASDAGACTSGEVIHVDGGYHVLGMPQAENL